MINPMNMSGRNVLVSGASSGIGRETAILLSQLGAHVVLVARNREKLSDTLSRLDGSGHTIQPFDLTETDDIPTWLKSIVDSIGPLDGLVHSAGISLTRPLRFTSSSDFDEVMRINVGAAYGLTKGFRQKGCHVLGGSIVLISSVAGVVGIRGLSAYSASKGALNALTKSLSLELVSDGIRINSIVAGLVKTEMVDAWKEFMTAEQFSAMESMLPLGMGTATDIAYAIAFLLADTGRWITGTNLVVDGGWTAH